LEDPEHLLVAPSLASFASGAWLQRHVEDNFSSPLQINVAIRSKQAMVTKKVKITILYRYIINKATATTKHKRPPENNL
jgi:hypothetical protein